MTNETELREALRARADEIEVPDDLAQRTIKAARDLERPSLLARWRARRHLRTGPPRWAYAGTAAAVLVGLFALGESFTGDTATIAVDADEEVAAERAVDGRTVVEDFAATSSGASAEPADAAPPTVRDTTIGPTNPGAFPPQVIREADLEVEVAEGSFDEAWASANEIASRHDGFVTSSSSELLEDDFARGSLVVRVPSEKLDAALRDFRGLGKLVRMSTSGIDVAGRFVDLDARIRAAKAEETQLLELMRQARTLSDTLEIRSRLSDVREEIEQLDSQRDFLQSQVDFATIRATIFEPQAKPEDFGPGRFDDAFDRAFDVAQAIFAGTILLLGVLVPLGIIAGVIWLFVSLLRRRRAV